MRGQLSDGLQMPSEAVNQALVVTTPFPRENVAVLRARYECFVVIEDDQISDMVFFDV